MSIGQARRTPVAHPPVARHPAKAHHHGKAKAPTRKSHARTKRTTHTRKVAVARGRHGVGPNPKLAQAVKAIHIDRFASRGRTTFCNQAFNAYAKQMGDKGFNGLVANQIYKKMNAPGSGWTKVSAQDAMAAAKDGKLVAAAWYNSRNQPGRPDGKAPGHVAAVIGEYAPGVPGIAQAGRSTFEWGPITATRANPTYFVRN